jgi:hypothetical protein
MPGFFNLRQKDGRIPYIERPALTIAGAAFLVSCAYLGRQLARSGRRPTETERGTVVSRPIPGATR